MHLSDKSSTSYAPPASSTAEGSQQARAASAPLHILRSRRRGNLLLDMPIRERLTLGFLAAALIAALVAGLIGMQRTLALSRQSDFYQRLLQMNTALNTGADYLQLMNTETHSLLDTAASLDPSHETISLEQKAIQGLATRYTGILDSYIAQDLLVRQPDQVVLLDQASQAGLVQQQQTLTASAQRTWLLYSAAQDQILQDVASGNLTAAERLIRFQVEPTNADALSALRALIQLDGRLADSVRLGAGAEEQGELIVTIIGILCAALAIALVGWFISGTLVRRLRHLQQVTHAVEHGDLEARVTVIGRDEIAEVSAAFNAMLEAILSLLQETRRQRDVLTNAAEHLFSETRVISSDELRTRASTSTDPTGMLADALNFAVGRLRRFMLRVQSISQQLDVLARQQLERAEAFALTLNAAQEVSPAESAPAQISGMSERSSGSLKESRDLQEHEIGELIAQLRRSHERLQKLSVEALSQRLSTLLKLMQEAASIAGRYGEKLPGEVKVLPQDLYALEMILQRTKSELLGIQHNTLHAFSELDRDMKSCVQELSYLKARAAHAVATPGPAKEWAEATHKGAAFATEMTMLARQAAHLAQQMRSGVANF